MDRDIKSNTPEDRWLSRTPRNRLPAGSRRILALVISPSYKKADQVNDQRSLVQKRDHLLLVGIDVHGRGR